MSILKKILLLEKGDTSNILNQKITNPKTDRKVKVKSALGYEDGEPVKKKAQSLVKKAGLDVKDDGKKNPKSHKPKSNHVGINKELVEMLKKKGYQVTIPPPAYVKAEDMQFNPNFSKKTADKEWSYKFKCLSPSGKSIIKTAYTPEFMKRSAQIKFNRISKIKEKDVVTIETKTNKLLEHKDPRVKQSAMVISIIAKTGQRVGSKDETESGNLGIRTLKKENIKIEGDTIKLSFIGKSYQENYSEIKDKNLAKVLQAQIKDVKPGERIFPDCSYADTEQIFEKVSPGKLKIKDLRTYKACEKTKEKLEDKSIAPPPLSDNPKEATIQIKEKLKTTFEYVSTILNNSPTMAKNSYIHPTIIKDWLDSLGVTPEKAGYKHSLLSKVKESMMQTEGEVSKKERPTQSSMDAFFKKYSGDVSDEDYDSDEEMEEDLCDEYPSLDWLFDDDVEFVKK